jgi:hypothetical protein
VFEVVEQLLDELRHCDDLIDRLVAENTRLWEALRGENNAHNKL